MFSLFLFCSNVVHAMGINPHPFLAHIQHILHQDPEVLVKSMDLLPGKFLLTCLKWICFILLLKNFSQTFAGKSKGAVGYVLKFDHILINAIARGHALN
jgi:hypothetical protein